jgi:hypothetical protein
MPSHTAFCGIKERRSNGRAAAGGCRRDGGLADGTPALSLFVLRRSWVHHAELLEP